MKIQLRLLAFAVVTSMAWPVQALVIDDFSVGAINLSGHTELSAQTNLDPAHVVGGARHTNVDSATTSLTMSPSTGLVVDHPSGWGYFTLMYGYDAPLNANFTANGHDRLRLVIDAEGSEAANGIMWISINSPLPPRSNAPGPRMIDFRGGGIFEIPFSVYSTNLSDVDTFAIDVVRMTGGFVLRSVTTAGPPLAGDFNRDGLVNGDDLNEFRSTFGRTTAITVGYGATLSADENQDGSVDGSDFLAWQRALSSAPQPGGPIPEPAAGILAAIALAVLHVGHRGRAG